MPTTKTVWVRATQRGFYGDRLREAGDVFSVTGALGRWMEECEPTAKDEAEAERERLAKEAWERSGSIGT